MTIPETFKAGSANDFGVSRSELYRGVAAGKYVRIARGIYRAAAAPAADLDWLEAASRRPDATICLTSALAYYDLTDAIPGSLDIAIPRGSRLPATDSAIRWRLFDRSTFEIGRDAVKVPGTGQSIGIYSPERSIADALRLRSEVGFEVGRDALREWLRRGGKPAVMAQLAEELPRARGPLLSLLGAMA